MKKFLLAVIVAVSLTSVSPAGAQEKPVDLIVLLDASQSMFPFFTEVVDFVVSRIAREYLRFGDTFHLLTFTDTAQIEIAQSVRTEQDLKSLLGRLYLLYPLGRNTDLVSALSSLYQYASDLPESNRKLIIMVTDGMHNPSPKSPYSGLSVEEVRTRIEQTTARIRENGWTIRIVRVPFNGTNGTSVQGTAGSSGTGGPGEVLGSSPGAGDYLSEVATGLGAPITDFSSESREDAALRSVEIPHATFPGHLGRVDYDFSFPLALSNLSSRNLQLELTGVYSQGRNLLRKNQFMELPSGTERIFQVPIELPTDRIPGESSLEIELRFADGVRVVPTTGILAFELVYKPFARLFRTTGRAIVFLSLLILALALIIVSVLYIRSLHRRAEQPIVTAVLDSEAAAAAERRATLASVQVAGVTHKHISTDEAKAFQEDLALKHVTAEEAQSFQTDLSLKHVTQEEARIFGESRKSITEEEAIQFSSSNAITSEEAARYRDETSKSAAEALAAFAAASNRRSVATTLIPVDFTPTIKRAGSLRIEFRVEDQNPYIGLRNVHTLHSGGKKTIGGRRSDFLVFLVSVPQRVADVFFDGEDLTIVPVKPDYFPDYSGPIHDCLHNKVQMVTRHGKILTLSFEPYAPPADRLNRLLHCIDAPGLLSLEELTVFEEKTE